MTPFSHAFPNGEIISVHRDMEKTAAHQSAHVHLTEPSLDFFARVYLQSRGGVLPSAPMIVSWNDSAIDPSRASRQSADEVRGVERPLRYHRRRDRENSRTNLG